MDIEKAVGAELKAAREKQGISQEKLGFDAGIHRTYVSLIERGVKNPTLGVLFRLCQVLGVSPATFVRNVERRMQKKDKEDASGWIRQQ
jgi:transcriptional regulator with XRE-family HTH domain